jgi:hypothetical protein
MLMLQHEAKTGAPYDRMILIRPDIFMIKDLTLAALPRSPKVVYCNSHGRGAGDFHFVMEHAHVERLSTALWSQENPTKVVGNHNNMLHFMVFFNTTVKNDNQVFQGFHQDVYRKIPWHIPTCNAAPWWRSYLERNYGMNDEDWRDIGALVKSGVHGCDVHGPLQILNHCCRQGTCVELHLKDAQTDPTCGKRVT